VTVASEATRQIIRVRFPEAFHHGWNAISGVTAQGTALTIDPEAYFFRYTNPTWVVCDWDSVAADLVNVSETTDSAIEQIALDYVRTHGQVTDDPAEVLSIAYQAYSWLFRAEHLSDPGLMELGVTAQHRRMLTEMGTMMALNRVELTGEITNVGPAWMFGEAAKVVYGIEGAEAELLDELYHGTWFNETRRIESVKAHVALGGRLVHGCQSGTEINMAGGAVAPYGADMDRFRLELGTFRHTWIQAVRACGK
jgi:hypothetical protein